MSAAQHVLVIEPPIAEGHYQQMRIECPGVTDDCRAWDECRRQHSDFELELLENEEPVHGREHQRVGNHGWCVPTETCWLQTTEIADEVSDWNLNPGRYHFTWVSEDGGEYVTFPTVTPVAETEVPA